VIRSPIVHARGIIVPLVGLAAFACGTLAPSPDDPALGDDAGVDGDTPTSEGGPLDSFDAAAFDASACQRCYVFVADPVAPGSDAGFKSLREADAICTRLANAPGVAPPISGRAYVAWLSDSSFDVTDRMSHAGAPYVLPSGKMVAADWNALLDAGLQAPIAETLDGGPTGTRAVYTGTDSRGRASTADCSDWLFTDGHTAMVGSTASTDSHWTDDALGLCTEAHSIYCFQQ
jgi:hypothetical protein